MLIFNCLNAKGSWIFKAIESFGNVTKELKVAWCSSLFTRENIYDFLLNTEKVNKEKFAVEAMHKIITGWLGEYALLCKHATHGSLVYNKGKSEDQAKMILSILLDTYKDICDLNHETFYISLLLSHSDFSELKAWYEPFVQEGELNESPTSLL